MNPLALLLSSTMWSADVALPPEGPVIDTPVRVLEIGRYRRLPAPHPGPDPVPPLGDDDRAALAKPTAKTWDALVDGFADRCAATYATAAPPTAALAAWFAQHPREQRAFWLAIDPQFDDPAAAVAVLDRLLAIDAKRFARYFEFAIAMAVVWDQPDAVASSRFNSLWAVTPEQFPPAMGMEAVWAWFTDDQRQAQMRFKPTTMTWPLMVHLADLAITSGEAAWAIKNYGRSAGDIGPLYAEVPYDNDKLARRPTKLGAAPYVLSNLRGLGGVCVDQGHFAAEIAKALGVPAMKCTGEGRYGGNGHAWTGFLIARKGKPILDFTGRYDFDFYYTGDVFDPQTRTMVLDRHVALLYDAVSSGPASWVKARTLARIAQAIEASEPPLAARLSLEAIRQNRFVAEAWRTYFRLAAAGAVERKEANAQANQLIKDLAAHPDVTIECLDDILRLTPDDRIDDRQRLFESAYAVYATAKRPDLQIRLRQRQCAELVAAGRQMESLKKALETVRPNAKEGSLILPLVEQIVTDTLSFRTTVKGFRSDVVQAELKKTAQDFPQKRGDEVSEAWLKFRGLCEKL